MKKILKLVILSVLFTISSCAHHGKKYCDSKKCDMHKDGKKEQCHLKTEQTDSSTSEAAPVKK